jgi:hypothetical protein
MLFCSQPNNHFIKYCRLLGWSEFNEDTEEEKDVAIVVIDSNIGYSVFRDGSILELVAWYSELEDALDEAVERVRYEHAKHEIGQEKDGCS